MYLLNLFTISVKDLNLNAFTPREMFVREITFYAKLRNKYSKRVLKLTLILVINRLTYQGRAILKSVR